MPILSRRHLLTWGGLAALFPNLMAGDAITVKVAPKTDFWRKTSSGVIRHNGHFRHQEVSGDFTAQVKFTGQYAARYDQAGLMVRADKTTWLKCGIEYIDGTQFASAVVTRDYSDWSMVPLQPAPDSVWFQVKREGSTLEVAYSLDGDGWTMIRQAHLTDAPSLEVGPMAASPEGDGFSVTFEGFSVK